MCKCFNVKLDGDDDDDDAVHPEIDKVLDDHCSKQTRAQFFLKWHQKVFDTKPKHNGAPHLNPTFPAF